MQAAIKDQKGTVFSLERPARHKEVALFMLENGCDWSQSWVPGYLLPDGRFVDREEAAGIAYTLHLIENPKEKLYSEDLW
jgi:hypothetical protein